MREIVFKCDNCGKELSGGGKHQEHITMEFQKNKFGIAHKTKRADGEVSPESFSDYVQLKSMSDLDKKEDSWRVTDDKNPGWEIYPFSRDNGILQFCDVACLTKWVTNKESEIKLRIMNK
jgi:hypothetical protein